MRLVEQVPKPTSRHQGIYQLMIEQVVTNNDKHPYAALNKPRQRQKVPIQGSGQFGANIATAEPLTAA